MLVKSTLHRYNKYLGNSDSDRSKKGGGKKEKKKRKKMQVKANTGYNKCPTETTPRQPPAIHQISHSHTETDSGINLR